MSWQAVCAEEAVREGTPVLVTIGRREVGIIRHRETLHAVLNFCPHAGAPIARGRVESPVTADEPGGGVRVDADHPVLRCPWHHWEFDLATGASLCPIKPRINVFPVRVQDGQVWIDA